VTPGILGWDIGGVNTKGARVDGVGTAPLRTLSLPYELQREPTALASVLRSAAGQLGETAGDRHAVTMTAELSQAFRSKREGVSFVLDALESVFPVDCLHVYTVPGKFVSTQEARLRGLEVAASNWSATASWVARHRPTCVLVDIGTSTTDLIPVVDGRVAATGSTDPERLLARELIYTGAVRTPVEAVVRQVPLWGGTAGVSAEGFALIGDVHLWLGNLKQEDYTCPTPDRRPVSRDYAGERLARVVCGDREMLDDTTIDGIALAVARAQRDEIVGGLIELRRRHQQIDTALVAGIGEFIGAEAAACAGLDVAFLSQQVGSAAVTAPAAAVAWLLQESLLSA
jgi:probable H4MPT-linked C1 transfer pathway protein